MATTVTHVDNNSGERVNIGGKIVNESGTKEPSIERELIDLLKEQIKIKDGQLREQGEQLKDINDLNVKLTGTMLQQNQKIENLLRLTGGKSDVMTDRSAPANQSPEEATTETTGTVI